MITHNTCVNNMQTVYVFGVHITLLWSYQFSISKEGKYLLARWYWGLHVCSIKKQVSVFDDDTFFGLPKARPTYCQCAKLFKNGTFWQHTTTGTRLGIFNLGGLNTLLYEHSNSSSFELKKWFKPWTFESWKLTSKWEQYLPDKQSTACTANMAQALKVS